VVSAGAALVELLRLLKQRDYRFTTVTPATHARVIARGCTSPGLRDIFGWNRPFGEADLDPDLLRCLADSGMVERDGGKLRSKVRVASLGDDLFLHSAYPTTDADAVFFGPDTYRFVRFVSEQLAALRPEPRSVVDMGTGSGAGAIAAARLLPGARVTAVDVNPAALKLAGINAQAAGVDVETVCASTVPRGADLIIANPPYIIDPGRRAYRDGGELLGGQVALEWVRQGLQALTPGGAMLLYAGASVVNGNAPLVDALREICASGEAYIQIDETDPDVFGEELEQAAYENVERIAVIHVTIRRA
jgi:methylase of polypeptide subunit release factors